MVPVQEANSNDLHVVFCLNFLHNNCILSVLISISEVILMSTHNILSEELRRDSNTSMSHPCSNC